MYPYRFSFKKRIRTPGGRRLSGVRMRFLSELQVLSPAKVVAPQFPEYPDHGAVALHWDVIRNGISGAECKAAVSPALAYHIGNILPHLRLGKAADGIGINTAEIADTVSLTPNPLRKAGDLVFIGVLGVNTRSDKILHHWKNASAGVKEKRFSPAMGCLNDPAVLGDDVSPDIAGRKTC